MYQVVGYFCWCIHVYTCVFEGDLLELVLGSHPLYGGPVNKIVLSIIVTKVCNYN